MSKLLVLLILILIPSIANAGITTSDSQTTITTSSGGVISLGALGPNTFADYPDGTHLRFGVSDTSTQIGYDVIEIGQDTYETTGCRGGDITFKLHHTGSGDVPFGNIGYGCNNNQNMVLEAGGTEIQNNGWQFNTMDGAGHSTSRFFISGGASGTAIGVGESSISNPAGLSSLVEIKGASAGFTATNGTQNYSWFINSGYSNSWMLWNGSLYAQAIYPNGHTIIDGTSDDGVNNLQVNGTIAMTGSNLIVETTHTPASSSEACVKGTFVWDTNYLDLCVSTNVHKHIALVSY